jgi:hypothetical protein
MSFILAGLLDAKANAKGVLTLTPDALVFNNSNARALIAVTRIIAVSTGDERLEKGGTAGKVARKAIPYGAVLCWEPSLKSRSTSSLWSIAMYMRDTMRRSSCCPRSRRRRYNRRSLQRQLRFLWFNR